MRKALRPYSNEEAWIRVTLPAVHYISFGISGSRRASLSHSLLFFDTAAKVAHGNYACNELELAIFVLTYTDMAHPRTQAIELQIQISTDGLSWGAVDNSSIERDLLGACILR